MSAENEEDRQLLDGLRAQMGFESKFHYSFYDLFERDFPEKTQLLIAIKKGD